MDGVLEIYPLASWETQVCLIGRYQPPLGLLGRVGDALIGHRLAEESIGRFFAELVERMEQALASREAKDRSAA